MQVLRLSHLLDDRNSLSFQNKVLSVQHSRIACDDTFVSCKKYCHMYAYSQCQSAVCASDYLAAIKAARFCKQTDSNGASTLISYTCLRTLLPRATAYEAQQVSATSLAAFIKHTRCTCLLASKQF